jgi:hypothetical protein
LQQGLACEEGKTPLITAIEYLEDPLPIVKLLLSQDDFDVTELTEWRNRFSALEEMLIRSEFDEELCRLLMQKVDPSEENWHDYQLPCGITFLQFALNDDNADAISFLVDCNCDFSDLSPDMTRWMRELTGDRRIMCDADREKMDKTHFRRAEKAFCRIIEAVLPQEGLEHPFVRKEFYSQLTLDCREEFDADASNYESGSTSSLGDSNSDIQTGEEASDASQNGSSETSHSLDGITIYPSPMDQDDEDPSYVDYPSTPPRTPSSSVDEDEDLPLSSPEWADELND